MPTNPPIIVPAFLDPQSTKHSSLPSFPHAAEPNCVIKTATAEISFFNGVDERIIQTIMKELNGR